MADHVRKQIRDAALTALTGLTTTGTKVYKSRVYNMQDANLPGLRVYMNEEDDAISSMGVSRVLERGAQLVVEACVKQNDSFDDTLETIHKEVEIALKNGLTGAKHVTLRRIEIELCGEGEKPVAVSRMTFDAPYYTQNGVPDAAL